MPSYDIRTQQELQHTATQDASTGHQHMAPAPRLLQKTARKFRRMCGNTFLYRDARCAIMILVYSGSLTLAKLLAKPNRTM